MKIHHEQNQSENDYEIVDFDGEELDAAVADINGDGKINVLDVSALYALVMNNG